MFCVEAGVVFSTNLFVLTIGETECYITATKISQPGGPCCEGAKGALEAQWRFRQAPVTTVAAPRGSEY